MNKEINESNTKEVHILLIQNSKRLEPLRFNKLLKKIPNYIHSDILKYQKSEDRQATLLGKWLLIKGLELLKIHPKVIHSLQKDKHKRPFLKDVKTELDFNIAHSEGVVTCILGKKCQVGIDIEMIQSIILEEYQNVFTDKEWKTIQLPKKEEEKISRFFKYWTRKEAIMKADGRGFYLEPTSFETIKTHIIIDEKIWHLQEIEISQIQKKVYKCHIATSQKVNVQVYFFDVNDI